MENRKFDVKSFIIGILLNLIIFDLFFNQNSNAGNNSFTLWGDDNGVYILNTGTGEVKYRSKSDCYHGNGFTVGYGECS